MNSVGHISGISVGVRQAGTRTVAAASVTLGQARIKIIKINSTFSSCNGKNNEIRFSQTRGGCLVIKYPAFCQRSILCGMYDSHKKLAHRAL